MKQHRTKAGSIAFLSVCAAVALLLSYVESLFPPLFAYAPGIKMGLPNVMIIFVLYRFGVVRASAVTLVRLVIASMLFGTPVTFLYSLAGAVLSLSVMAILKKTALFSTVIVSIAGGIMHNAGQILVAMVLLSTKEVGYYLIPLAVSGTVSGALIGILGALMIRRIPEHFRK